ncbi:VOC family protein [Sediminibacterium sp. KACHI17]|jgi:lactoylglutathione lyase|uniref:VOC family protein n=1 Tax=Sediminibacterium sp. KACHI17 TaxID=1751071 RepID=A0AAT9GGJ0_9BACT
MKIEHVAIWCRDLEVMRSFYISYFNAVSNELYINEKKQYRSYFLSFESGARLELMQMHSVTENLNGTGTQYFGLNHFAFSTGSKESVDELTRRLSEAGFQVVGAPRTTGDGYYESVVLDPENNRIEITI